MEKIKLYLDYYTECYAEKIVDIDVFNKDFIKEIKKIKDLEYNPAIIDAIYNAFFYNIKEQKEFTNFKLGIESFGTNGNHKYCISYKNKKITIKSVKS